MARLPNRTTLTPRGTAKAPHALRNLYNEPLFIEARREEIPVQRIEKRLEIPLWFVPIADGNDNVLREQAERHCDKPRIALATRSPRSCRTLGVLSICLELPRSN